MSENYNIIKMSILSSVLFVLFAFFLNYVYYKELFNLESIFAIITGGVIIIIAVVLQSYINNVNKKGDGKTQVEIKQLNRYQISKLIISLFLSFLIIVFFIFFFKGIFRVFPTPVGVINDYRNILSDDEEEQLSTVVKKVTDNKYFGVLFVGAKNISFYNDSKKYFIELRNNWAKTQKRDLVLIGYYGKSDIYIIPGPRTKKVLTPEITKHTLDNILIPEFNSGNYFTGLKKAIADLYEVMELLEK